MRWPRSYRVVEPRDAPGKGPRHRTRHPLLAPLVLVWGAVRDANRHRRCDLLSGQQPARERPALDCPTAAETAPRGSRPSGQTRGCSYGGRSSPSTRPRPPARSSTDVLVHVPGRACETRSLQARQPRPAASSRTAGAGRRSTPTGPRPSRPPRAGVPTMS